MSFARAQAWLGEVSCLVEDNHQCDLGLPTDKIACRLHTRPRVKEAQELLYENTLYPQLEIFVQKSEPKPKESGRKNVTVKPSTLPLTPFSTMPMQVFPESNSGAGKGTRGEAFGRCKAARSPEEWMRLRCVPSEAPGMHTGALVCLVPPPASLPAPSCSASLNVSFFPRHLSNGNWHKIAQHFSNCPSILQLPKKRRTGKQSTWDLSVVFQDNNMHAR